MHTCTYIHVALFWFLARWQSCQSINELEHESQSLFFKIEGLAGKLPLSLSTLPVLWNFCSHSNLRMSECGKALVRECLLCMLYWFVQDCPRLKPKCHSITGYLIFSKNCWLRIKLKPPLPLWLWKKKQAIYLTSWSLVISLFHVQYMYLLKSSCFEGCCHLWFLYSSYIKLHWQCSSHLSWNLSWLPSVKVAVPWLVAFKIIQIVFVTSIDSSWNKKGFDICWSSG